MQAQQRAGGCINHDAFKRLDRKSEVRIFNIFFELYRQGDGNDFAAGIAFTTKPRGRYCNRGQRGCARSETGFSCVGSLFNAQTDLTSGVDARQRDISFCRFARFAVKNHLAFLQNQRARTYLGDQGGLVSHQQDRHAAGLQSFDVLETFVLKRNIANRQGFINDQDIRIDKGRRRKGDAHHHASRTGP